MTNDNLTKSVLDGLNGVAYADDACVWEIHMEKVYSTPQEVAGLEVTLETKEDEHEKTDA